MIRVRVRVRKVSVRVLFRVTTEIASVRCQKMDALCSKCDVFDGQSEVSRI